MDLLGAGTCVWGEMLTSPVREVLLHFGSVGTAFTSVSGWKRVITLKQAPREPHDSPRRLGYPRCQPCVD
jgi:hypothetical protein